MPRSARTREPATRTRIKFLRILLVVAGLTGLAGISVLFGMMMAVAPQVRGLQQDEAFKSGQNTTLYDRDNNFLAELTAKEGRVIARSQDISHTMKQAVVAIEDRRFFDHKGVDVRGVGRALVRDIAAGSAREGASTIEQQFIKVVSKAQDERTVSAKIRETALAYHLSHQWSKDKILTEYLNAIYYGNGAYGIESAARTYFGQDGQHVGCGTRTNPCADELRPAEAALLAAIINSPSGNDPIAFPARAEKRRNIVLRAMRDQGMLNPVEYAEARSETIPGPEQIQPPRTRISTPGSGYYVGWISAQLAEKYGARKAFEGGLKVTTTIDPKLQSAAEASVGAWLGGTGPTASMVAIDNGTGEVRAMVGGPDFEKSAFNLATQGRRQPGSAFKPFVLAQALREGIGPGSTWESRKREFTVNKKTGEKFVVNNYEDNYAGVTTLANATAFSDNAVYAQLGIKIGTKKVATLAKEMGIRTPVSTNYAMTLGGLKTGVTPLDMAHAYETFATGGRRVWGSLNFTPGRGPVGIRKVEKKDGSEEPKINRRRTERVISEAAANTSMGILTGVVRIGSGKNAAVPGHLVWGKTGTTEDNGDAWFVGATEELTVAVWVGYADQTKPMLTEYQGGEVAGGTFPAQIWRTFILKSIDLEKQRRAKICAQQAKKGKKCAEDKPKPTTPATPLTGAAPATTTPPSAGSQPGTPAQGTPSTGGGTGGGTGGTRTPVTPQSPSPTPQTPQAPSGTEQTPPAGGGGTGGAATPGT